MKVHFIAIGGSVMHQLAIALKASGHEVSGSDDQIFPPSSGLLAEHGLMPPQMGWFPDRVSDALDAVILGMHAKADNPELLKAKALGLQVYSFPQYIYQFAEQKQRIVVAGSHGKTTVTAMIVHVLDHCGYQPDYLLGAKPSPDAPAVRLSANAPVMVIEGDEYLTSPLDPSPKFLHYQHHIGVVTGIAWDHINVFPTYQEYQAQFSRFIAATPKAGTLVFCQDDPALKKLVKQADLPEDVLQLPYSLPKHTVKNGVTSLKDEQGNYQAIQVFGDHNLRNIEAAKSVCKRLGVRDAEFYEAIATFKGASLRLELLGQRGNTHVFRDFAHAPSKLQATTQAVKKQFPKQRLIACMELHTFSSLNKAFFPHYKGSMDAADLPVVFFSPETVSHKKLPAITESEIRQAFAHKNLQVFTDAEALQSFLLEQHWEGVNLLLMSSGNFHGLDLNALTQAVLNA